MNTPFAKKQLVAALKGQLFRDSVPEEDFLSTYKDLVKGYVDIENCIAVLSDFKADNSHMYIGKVGKVFGFLTGYLFIDSAFEDCIFDRVHAEDLVQRDILELNYYRFRDQIESNDRSRYSTFIPIRVSNSQGELVTINHRTIYLKDDSAGNVRLAMCIYSLSADQIPETGTQGHIVDNLTGEHIHLNPLGNNGKPILGKRELEILRLISKGLGSKEVSALMHISVFTVARHRQNIIKKLCVANTIEAVRIALASNML